MTAERAESQSANVLPRFDGQLMNLGGWLRSLRQKEHLLPSDLSFFTKTGAQILNNGKVRRLDTTRSSTSPSTPNAVRVLDRQAPAARRSFHGALSARAARAERRYQRRRRAPHDDRR